MQWQQAKGNKQGVSAYPNAVNLQTRRGMITDYSL